MLILAQISTRSIECKRVSETKRRAVAAEQTCAITSVALAIAHVRRQLSSAALCLTGKHVNLASHHFLAKPII